MEPENAEEGAVEETKHATDEFGVTLDKEGNEVTQENVIKEKEGKKEGKEEGGKKKEDEEGKEKSPELIALEAKVEEYSKNLTGQNDIISKLNTKISVLEAGGGNKEGEEGKEGETVLFKDIKFSKDLTEDQRDDMTETEIVLFDANATQQLAMNKMFETIKAGQKTQEDSKVEDLNSSAKTEATKLAEEAIKTNPELATDQKELTDKIIVEFNEFNNEGISPEKLIERMKKALNNVNGYTPPKENENKGGGGAKKPVKDGAGAGKDPHGVDAIIAGANKQNDGDYAL